MKRFRWLSFLLLVVFQGICSSIGGGAEPSRTLAVAPSSERIGRVAVVIGNSKYPSGALANPKNDATAMAVSLKKLGFDVELKLDASKSDIEGLMRRFSAKAEKAGVAAMFYAGHGIQVAGSNYLVPIDANPRSERDLKRDMIKMDDVIDDMGDAKVKLVFFDACRDNPLAKSFSRSNAGGMAAPVEATGTLISFATKHGNTAADGAGSHSPYTTALLAALEKPNGVEIEQLLRRVQQGVKQDTNGQQEPWRYGSLDGDFYFRPADPVDNAKAQQEAVERAIKEATRAASDQAAREKAELEKSIRTQQAAADKAAQESLKRANEQAAKERAELQQSLKAQQEASERAMAEAIKRNNEQAVRERAELQQSMEKMLKEALAKQNEALGYARASRGEVVAAVPVVPVPIPQPAGRPVQLASITPVSIAGDAGPSAEAVAALAVTPGDEWEYLSKDERFGKRQKLLLRVKAATPEGVLEGIFWNDAPVLDWVFGQSPAAIALPNESNFMFAPHWIGTALGELRIEGGSGGTCAKPGSHCALSMKAAGTEKITIAAGTFDAIRFDGYVLMHTMWAKPSGPVTIWYSKEHHRLLKQVVEVRQFGIHETLELSAVRRAPR